MKTMNKMLLICFAAFLFYCQENPTTSVPPQNFPAIPAPAPGQVPDSVYQAYESDAGWLAMHYLFQNQLPETADVQLPDPIFHSFLNGLLHIHLYARSQNQKPVMNLHHILRREVHQILLTVQKDIPWLDKWRQGKMVTGEPIVDSLMTTFHLQHGRIDDSSLNSWAFVTISSPEPLNTQALSREFARASGVIWAQIDHIIGDGSRIEASVSIPEQHILYRLSVGWGDCPAGCIARHYWDYKVDTAGRVDFLGESGDPLPSP